jgi:PPM family protein phosphatase
LNAGQIKVDDRIHPLFSTGFLPMSINLQPDLPVLVIKENICFSIEHYRIEVVVYLGCFTPGIHSFQVSIQSDEESDSPAPYSALLRIGASHGGLDRELQFRKILGEYGLIAKLIAEDRLEAESVRLELTSQTLESSQPGNENISKLQSTEPIVIDPRSTLRQDDENLTESIDSKIDPNLALSNEKEALNLEVDVNLELENLTKIVIESEPVAQNEDTANNSQIDISEELRNIQNSRNTLTPTAKVLDPEEEFLTEEFFPETVAGFDPKQPQILLVTEWPSETHSLKQWIDRSPSPTEALSLAIQMCQCCSFFARKGWTIINLTPRFIEFKDRLKICDLTHVYPLGETPASGLIEEYYAPELASGSAIDEVMSTYMVGALFYQVLHHHLPTFDRDFNFQIKPIPRLYQLLKISLSPIPNDRFLLSQFQQLLLEARQELETPKVHWNIATPKVRWNIASHSTVGLSTSRLQNEDSFAIKQQLSDRQNLIIGAVADGMGGMAQGEVASRIAIETILGHPVPWELRSPEQLNTWFLDLFQKANRSIGDAVRNGGTTLSVVMALDRVLTIGHVGDSRIYLIHQGKLQQLSQDHSYVGLLVNNGEITEEQSQSHPDRNILIKSLGSTTKLSNGYVQTMQDTIKHPSLNLEDRDILLLCSDGVWDLVSKPELTDIFSSAHDLQAAVDLTIQKVIDGGASDNATLLALQICLDYPAAGSSVN